jgi:hypothetical protein
MKNISLIIEGRISFFDIKAGKFHIVDGNKPYYQTGKGWLDRDEIYYSHFNGKAY